MSTAPHKKTSGYAPAPHSIYQPKGHLQTFSKGTDSDKFISYLASTAAGSALLDKYQYLRRKAKSECKLIEEE